MNTFLETLRAKPEHIRRQIALATAVGITSVVTLGWGAAIVTSGKLAFVTDSSSNAGVALTQSAQTAEETTNAFGTLVGAASAAFTSSTTSAPAALSVVDQDSSSTLERTTAKEERTVIPF